MKSSMKYATSQSIVLDYLGLVLFRISDPVKDDRELDEAFPDRKGSALRTEFMRNWPASRLAADDDDDDDAIGAGFRNIDDFPTIADLLGTALLEVCVRLSLHPVSAANACFRLASSESNFRLLDWASSHSSLSTKLNSTSFLSDLDSQSALSPSFLSSSALTRSILTFSPSAYLSNISSSLPLFSVRFPLSSRNAFRKFLLSSYGSDHRSSLYCSISSNRSAAVKALALDVLAFSNFAKASPEVGSSPSFVYDTG